MINDYKRKNYYLLYNIDTSLSMDSNRTMLV